VVPRATPTLQNCGSHGHTILKELWLVGSGYRNFVRMTKSDLEIMLQKTGPRIQGKETKFREASLPSIRLAATLRYLASGDFSPNFGSTDFTFFFLQENQSHHLFDYDFCDLHNAHSINTHCTANPQ
jgi:hypothetical protein